MYIYGRGRICITTETELKTESSYSFKAIFRIFYKTDRKRLLITTITGLILFMILTTFFVSWISYRYNFFNNEVASADWTNDNKVSFSFVTHSEGSIGISSSFLPTEITSTRQRLNDIIPEANSKYTAALYMQLYYHEVNFSSKLDMKFMSFDSSTEDLIESNLAEGRLPENSEEIVFYNQNTSLISVTLGQVITLGNNVSLSSHIYNYTVVGIIENADVIFTQNGKSQDMFKDIISQDTVRYEEVLITTFDYYVENTIKLVQFYGKTAYIIDFNYVFQPYHIRQVPKYIRLFQTEELDYNHKYSGIPFCLDLYNKFVSFRENWLTQTITIFATATPFLLVFGLVCIETFQIGSHNLQSKFKIMKVQGMEYKTIRKMILLENLISSIITFVGGILLGIFIGFFVYLVLVDNYSSDFILSLGEPVMLISLFLLFTLFFVGGFLIENNLAKKTTKTTSSRYKEKRSKLIRQIFSSNEFLISLPGTVLIAIGFIGLYLAQIVPYDSVLKIYFIEIFLILWFLIILGAIFILAAVFMLASRVIAFAWSKIGKVIWTKTKSFLTLSFKHISIYSKDFRRIILATFILGLGITPGLIIKKSVNDYIPIESKLSTGYSDIMIPNWSTIYDPWKDDITDIEGIERTTKIKIYTLYSYSALAGGQQFEMRLFSILNVTEFMETIDYQLFADSRVTVQDIYELENNMSYLMDEKYAKKNGHSRGVVFVTSMLSSYNEPYEMNFTNYYDIFPLMYHDQGYIFNPYDNIGLVTCELTASQLIDYSSPWISISTASFLLIRTASDANLTYVKDEISNYGLSMLISSDVEQSKFDELNDFNITLLIVGSIISIAAAIFFGYITARNLYYQRVRIIESEYQIGAKRKQIWSSFTIELLFIILVPILLSFAITLPILNNTSSLILSIQETYSVFKPWFPVWIFIPIVLLIISTILGGWLPSIIYLVRKYRPIKQE
ncbi:MAG: ABC transporter permease [Asgard group archaeon]|nr:ABC transporter permease [Asgard group archaeon]